MTTLTPEEMRDKALPLALIRSHLKLDDISGVGGDQLALYRDAAVEAFEAYTGRVFGCRRQIRQVLNLPRFNSLTQFVRARIMCQLDHPTSDGILTVTHGSKSRVIRVVPDAFQFEWPPEMKAIPESMLLGFGMFTGTGIANACAPCGAGNMMLPEVAYTTGDNGPIPAGVRLGCLKFIAWQYEHPGDEFAMVADRALSVQSGSMQGTNNAAVASGAYAEWRRFKIRIAL